MTIETTRDNICINQIIEQRKDNFIIEGDAIIPDIKPDILSTISTSGTICIYKKEIQNGKIKIDGTINTYIMYLADSETNNIRSINTNLDFTQTINMEKAVIISSCFQIPCFDYFFINLETFKSEYSRKN